MQELTMKEIEQVNGGFFPVAIAFAKGVAAGVTLGCAIFGLYEATVK